MHDNGQIILTGNPQDPIRWNCNESGFPCYDSKGDKFIPDIYNYMAYLSNGTQFRDHFSLTQGQTMIYYAGKIFGNSYRRTNDFFDKYEPDDILNVLPERNIEIDNTIGQVYEYIEKIDQNHAFNSDNLFFCEDLDYLTIRINYPFYGIYKFETSPLFDEFTDFDTEIYLRKITTGDLIYDDDSGIGKFSKIENRIYKSGQYSLQIKPKNSIFTGYKNIPYNLTIDLCVEMNQCISDKTVKSNETYKGAAVVELKYPCDMPGNNLFVIEQGGSTFFKAGESIILGDGFHAKEGSYFSAVITDVIDCEDNSRLIVQNISTNSYSRNEELYSNSEIIEKNNILFEYTIFPNPNKGKFTIELTEKEDNIRKVEIKTLTGNTVFFKSFSSQVIPIFCEDLASGLYLIRILTDKNIYNTKIIIEK